MPSIAWRNWFVVRYFWFVSIKIAKSLVIDPVSTQSIQTFSNVFANFISSSFASNFPLWASPLVQAKIDDLPFKELRRLVDQGKKDIKEGIVVIYAIKDDKIGLAVGVTDSLTKNYDAIKFVKSGSEILGGKGGGGRSDFAQAGGVHSNKIEESFEKIKSLI